MWRSLGRIVLLCLFGLAFYVGGFAWGLHRGIDIGIEVGVEETLKLFEPIIIIEPCDPWRA